MPNKIDSNFTGLRYALETPGQPKTLPGVNGADAIWFELEPNSYSDFGGTTTLKARSPITAGRQRRKGRAVDLDAKGGFTMDFTSDNMLNLMPSYFFAAWRKGAFLHETADQIVVAAAGKTFTKAASFGAGTVGGLILASGFGVPANNGVKHVTAATANALTVSEALTDEAGAVGQKVKLVGFQGAAADITVDATDPKFPFLGSTVFDFTTLGLVPGAWVYVGGDAAGVSFAEPGNNGFARVAAIAAHKLTFDKTQNAMVTTAGAGKTVQVFLSDFIKNESNPELITTQTVQFERSLSSAGFEYLPGSFANELTVDMKSADKIELTLDFIALDAEEAEYADRKPGSFPDIATSPEAYNTSTDLVRIRAAHQGDAAPLFAFMQTMSFKINNNVSPLKALGVFGSFDVSIGDFVVEGDITAYFSDIAAVAAVRKADSLTIDFGLALDNRGWMFDIPHLVFDKGNLTITKDAPITIPVGINAAADQKLNTTLTASYFAYLPDAASA